MEFSELAGRLFRAASTTDCIRWDRLATMIEKAEPAMSDDERVKLLVRAANGRALPARQLNQLVGINLVTLAGSGNPVVRLSQTDADGLARSLGVLVEGTARERSTALTQLHTMTHARLVLVPEGSRSRVIAADLAAAFAYALILASDTRKFSPGAQKLRRCRYSACRKFFFAPIQPGQPQKHCTLEHGRLADSEAAAERMRRIRSRRR